MSRVGYMGESTRHHLLDEYTATCIEIERMRNKIIVLRDTTKTRMMSAKTGEERRTVFREFRAEVGRMKREMAQPYKLLRARRDELRGRLTDTDDRRDQATSRGEGQDDLSYLLNKYSARDRRSESTSVGSGVGPGVGSGPGSVPAPGVGSGVGRVTDLHYSEQHNEINRLVKSFGQ